MPVPVAPEVLNRQIAECERALEPAPLAVIVAELAVVVDQANQPTGRDRTSFDGWWEDNEPLMVRLLADVPAADLSRACFKFMQDSPFMPKAADIRRIAMPEVNRRRFVLQRMKGAQLCLTQGIAKRIADEPDIEDRKRDLDGLSEMMAGITGALRGADVANRMPSADALAAKIWAVAIDDAGMPGTNGPFSSDEECDACLRDLDAPSGFIARVTWRGDLVVDPWRRDEASAERRDAAE